MHPAPYLLVGDQSEYTLDLIDPGRPGRREVHVPAWSLCQAVPDRLGAVGCVIVHHQMHVEAARDAVGAR